VVTERWKMLSRTVRLVLVAWLMGAVLAGTAVAGPFEDGDAAHKRGDYAEAVKWYRKAAEQGDAEAQSRLGFLYYMGQGVPQDYLLAHMWFNLAASQYSASENKDRDDAVARRNAVAAKLTPALIVEAQKLAREWKPKR
jgi:TPR repeat protein